jgi:regulator of protease activity HflC (stomatin/prohibitin superfamily)
MFSLFVSAIGAVIGLSVFAILKGRNGNPQTETLRWLALAFGLLAAGAFLWQGLRRFLIVIPAGEVGIGETLGQVAEQTLAPGIHLTNPLTEVSTFSTRLQDLKETVETTSKEGLGFKIDVSLQYRLDPQRAGDVYLKVGNNEREIITSRFRSLVRQVTAQYPLTEIYGPRRSQIAQFLQQEMTRQLQPLGFIVEETLLREIVLPESIQAAIQSKVAAEQQTQQIEVEIVKARKDAERKKIEARGTAEAQKILSAGLTEQSLRLKQIEALDKLAQSQNSKIIILGGKDNSPLLLPSD